MDTITVTGNASMFEPGQTIVLSGFANSANGGNWPRWARWIIRYIPAAEEFFFDTQEVLDMIGLRFGPRRYKVQEVVNATTIRLG